MYQHIKRGIDLILALIAFILLSPLFIIISIAIKLESKGPVFFGQNRIGKDKKWFMMYKFRSMRIDTPHDMPTHLLEAPELYITKVGKVLRKTSLDELPQLIHIITGKMSIIGPRPALWNQDDLVQLREQRNANSIRPGLTGLAQVRGRDELSLEEKADYDGEYTRNMSFVLDLKILVRTILCVFHGAGIREGKTQHEETIKYE